MSLQTSVKTALTLNNSLLPFSHFTHDNNGSPLLRSVTRVISLVMSFRGTAHVCKTWSRLPAAGNWGRFVTARARSIAPAGDVPPGIYFAALPMGRPLCKVSIQFEMNCISGWRGFRSIDTSRSSLIVNRTFHLQRWPHQASKSSPGSR